MNINIYILTVVLISVSIESTGVMPPELIMTEGFKILNKKCEHFLQELDDYERRVAEEKEKNQ